MSIILKQVNTPEELEQAFTVRKKVFVEEQGVPIEEEIDQEENNAIHYLAMNEGEIIGTCRVRWAKPGVAKAERVAVLREGRGTGAGRQLMLAIEAYANQNHATEIVLSAQTHAIPFYEKLGYEVCSDIFLDAGIEHKKMTKVLE